MEKTFRIRMEGADQTFSAAHFITFSSGECEAVHGHDFHVSLELEQPLAEGGYVADFVSLHAALMEILKKLDHKTLLQGENTAFKFNMEEKEPEETPDILEWMSKMGGWLSNVNKYDADSEKNWSSDDYFQKMAQMTAEEMNLPSAEECETVQKAPKREEENTCRISNGMTALVIELEVQYHSRRWVFPMEDCVILPVVNTTAELLAEYLAEQVSQCELLADRKWSRLTLEVKEAPGMTGVCTLTGNPS